MTGLEVGYAPHPPYTLPPQANPEHLPTRELGKGDVLYRLGDDAEGIYRVEEGLLKLSIDLLSGRERIISIAGPGDLIGAITGPLHHSYQDTAEALSPQVRLSVIPSERAATDLELRDHLFRATSAYLTRLKEALEESELPVPARLARIMLRLGERYGHTSHDRTHLALPLTHENFAAMIGAARETTTAELTKLRAEGLIDGTRGHYSFVTSDLSDYSVTATF